MPDPLTLSKRCSLCGEQRDDLSTSSDGITTACSDCRGEADR